jgi:CRP/FNR family transcriptional regulator, cyclic AMP receptor protein
VTRVLTKLEKKGLIVRENDIMVIPDVPALERIIA